MSQELLKQQIAAVESFMASPAFSSFKATIQADIVACEQSILMTPPVTEADRGLVLMQYGRREMLQQQENFFEDARSILKAKLSDATEPEQ